MIEYKIIKDDEYVRGCENCSVETELANFPKGYDKSDQWLCEYCSSIIDKKSTIGRQIAQAMHVLEKRIVERSSK